MHLLSPRGGLLIRHMWNKSSFIMEKILVKSMFFSIKERFLSLTQLKIDWVVIESDWLN